jgi:hypothetical protein
MHLTNPLTSAYLTSPPSHAHSSPHLGSDRFGMTAIYQLNGHRRDAHSDNG